MSGFDDIKVGWKGAEYKIAPDRCMELLARLEEILAPRGSGLNILNILSKPHETHLTSWARAYGEALRYAGADVTDQDVYLSLSRDVVQGGVAGYQGILTLSQGIMFMFFPDWAQDEDLARQASEGNDDGAAPAPSTAE